MEKITISKGDLSQQELDFCDLYVFGCDPYAGNARKCYEDVYKVTGATTRKQAQELLEREDVQIYIGQLQKVAAYKTVDIKTRLTEKLLHIIDETSTAEYTDRRGTKLSPAPLRSVAVQASKALMEMYPVRVAQENKLELSGGDGNGSGITFNVIVPSADKKTNEE